MTAKDIVAQAEQLPLNEQWMVVMELLRLLQAETQAAEEGENAEARQRRLASIPPASAMLGILKPEGHIPTDEEIKEDYSTFAAL
ncbi:MAG TPA: hypothetical protein VJ793_01745 [Anaerolineae bacterium]|nr:hypothetical protein [Anaerolineae bacterium]